MYKILYLIDSTFLYRRAVVSSARRKVFTPSSYKFAIANNYPIFKTDSLVEAKEQILKVVSTGGDMSKYSIEHFEIIEV